MVSIKIEHLTKRFGKVEALKDLSLSIDQGEFFVLLGPSGCGKSTALLCLAGLLMPDEGEIWFGEQLVASKERRINVPPQDRGVAMVFQDYALYPHMTVFDNIAFPLVVRGEERSRVEAKVKEVAELLGILPLLDRKPKQLSGGQKQRVALGRAIVREPRLFLMDEPLANLDAQLRAHMRGELKKLQRSLGVTTVYVTHDQVEAMSMGDRIAILKEGELQQVGTPEDVYGRPDNTFVAGFIGSPAMNMLEGSLVIQGGRFFLDFGAFTYVLPSWAAKTLDTYDKPEVILGIRPEHIKVMKGAAGMAAEAKVDLIEPVGRELYAHLAVGNLSLTAIVDPGQAIKQGDRVGLTFEEDKIHLFDNRTGKALL